MHNKNKFKIFYQYRNLFIITSFIILSLLSTVVFVHSHILGWGSDTYFHWQRIVELKQSFNHHIFFPRLALSQFSGNGSAVMTFYPYFNILPVVFLSYFIKSDVNVIYFSFSLYTFITLIIAYYSSLHTNKRIDTSYLFSIIYGLSSFMLYNEFTAMDFGIVMSTAVFPMFIFGIIELIKNNYWLELSLGLTLLIFSHVLNALLAFALLFIWLLINIKKINRIKFISLIKCFELTLCTTAIFYVPVIKLLILNHIQKPYSFQLSGNSLLYIINNAINNNLDGINTISLFALLGIVFSVMFYKYLPILVKQMYWISIVILIICSKIFPWNLLNDSLFQIIQFSWRLYIIPQILLIYLLSLIITQYINNINVKYLLFIFSILLTCFLQISGQNQIITKYKNSNNFTTEINGINSSNTSIYDYYPYQSQNLFNYLINDRGIYRNNRYLQFHKMNSGYFNFNNPYKNIYRLNLPFVGYNGIKYKVYFNNHTVPFYINKNNLLTVNNVSKGKQYISIKVIPDITTIIIRILFFVGIIIYVYLLQNRYYFMRKHIKY